MTTTVRQQDIVFTAFSKQHVNDAVKLSSEAGWPHRSEDWELILSVSSGAVVVVQDDVVGTALRSDFGDVSTLSMIIVSAQMRGQGLGRKLMNRVMENTGDKELRLIATPDGLPLYEKLGFNVTGEIIQYQGVAQAIVPECAVEVVRDVDLAALAAMDHAASGMERSALLARIAEMGTVFLTKGGFAMLRPFGFGQVLGPVVAKDALIARSLMAAAAQKIEGTFLRIDTPIVGIQQGFFDDLGLSQVGGGVTMTAESRAHPTSDYQTFSVVAQALG